MVDQSMSRSCEVEQIFLLSDKTTASHESKCLEQVKLPASVHGCATYSELSSELGTMNDTGGGVGRG